MSKIDAKAIYKEFKVGERKYKEETHCPMIIKTMNEEGTMTAFCKKAFISDALFYDWVRDNELFARCYYYGKIISKSNWEEEGELGKDEEFFNFDLWRLKGAQRYGVGKNRVRFGINPKSDPYKQYQELIELSNDAEFNASEIKQLMESINVGIRAFETFKLQEEINKVKDDVVRMGDNNGNNLNSIEKITKTD